MINNELDAIVSKFLITLLAQNSVWYITGGIITCNYTVGYNM